MPSDWDAATYDRVSDPQVEWARVVVERISPEGVAVILDAGCGSGRVTELLCDRFPDANVVGVDVSEAMITEARRRLERYGTRVTLVRQSLLDPIPVTVDAVFSNAVFHWIDDHDRLFGNLARALRPGGQLVAQWGGKGNVSRLLEVAASLGAPTPPPRGFATAEATADRLRTAGFGSVRTWLEEAPALFATREAFECYLRTVCLRCHLDLLPPAERDAFVSNVADRLPDRTVDYVRLNATARRVER